jgi:hypothetical protein
MNDANFVFKRILPFVTGWPAAQLTLTVAVGTIFLLGRRVF